MQGDRGKHSDSKIPGMVTPAAILLIEDSDSIAMILDKLLTKNGHTVKRCRNLSEARQYLAQNSPALLISDLNLPDGRGNELINDLHGSTPSNDMRMIILSGCDPDMRLFNHPEKVEWIVKPFESAYLMERVRVSVSPTDQASPRAQAGAHSSK
jgi:DNA-binding response OmpR family regulator